MPGLTYKDKVLTLQGNVEAEVFDGRVVASNLRVREPLGAWPRLYADIVARNLDLELITRTFEFGSITGRLDVDLTRPRDRSTGRRSPSTSLMATPGDRRASHQPARRAEPVEHRWRRRRRGGARCSPVCCASSTTFATTASASSCRLRNDVCLMDGVGTAARAASTSSRAAACRASTSSAINRVVDWPRLVTQVS